MAQAINTPALADALETIKRQAARARRHATLSGDSLRRVGAAFDVVRDTSRSRIGERLALEDVDAVAQALIDQLGGNGEAADAPVRRCCWQLLDLLHVRHVLRRIRELGEIDRCMERIVALIEASHYTVHAMWARRAEQYGPRTWLRQLSGTRGKRWSWLDAAAQVERLARGLLAVLGPGPHKPVAIFSENRPEMIFADLACLTTGLVDVLVPPGATEADTAYILDHSRVGTLIVSTPELLAKIEPNRRSLEHLERVVLMEANRSIKSPDLTLDELIRTGAKVSRSKVKQAGETVRIASLASVMYTSGTTGLPKGIMFSQRNIVTKRFARALALPDLGERDVLLSYLPLCHTFGRFLEMLGSVFWGAGYCFASSPAIDTLVENMQRSRPTMFVSIPQKWIQLHERITSQVDVETATQAEIKEAVGRVTGGRLRWGLSAAGFLDPEIFRFFHLAGVELMSGFGMTEATGGITMTPPGEYREDSLGKPLPGIDVRLSDEGEMLIRGPYVMMGYVEPEGHDGGRPDRFTRPNSGDDDWVATGDLMQCDDEGHYRLVDRKKEIYKNTRGETIAPQRIENLFREFDDVKQVFLVGDHRPFNTALIVPNLQFEGIDLSGMSNDERMEYFRSHVVSVNRFLAPYERVIDFALLDRCFDEQHEELTKKGTYRRQRVVDHFSEVIDSLYGRSDLLLRGDGIEIRVPRTLLQILGLTARDFTVEKGEIVRLAGGSQLLVRASKSGRGKIGLRNPMAHRSKAAGSSEESLFDIGACTYRWNSSVIDLGMLLSTPALWLGNEALVEFAELPDDWRRRKVVPPPDLDWIGRCKQLADLTSVRDAIEQRLAGGDCDLLDVHYAALAIWGGKDRDALAGLRLLERVVADPREELSDLGRIVLRRAAGARTVTIRRRAFQVLVPRERKPSFAQTLEMFLPGIADILDDETIAQLCERGLGDDKIGAFLALVDRMMGPQALPEAVLPPRQSLACLKLLASYGATHPARFESIRYRVVQAEVLASSPKVRKEAGRLLHKLIDGFRSWLGQHQFIAVDPETADEYRWDDVITLEEEIEEQERGRLVDAIKNTTLVRESVFLFSGGDVARLKDIPPGGVWISRIGTKRGRSLFRCSVRTRHGGAYDFVINVNKSLSKREVADELNWVVLTSEPRHGRMLVEKLGGHWPEHGMWSEEFAALGTVERTLRRIARLRGEEGRQRLVNTWPYLAWNAFAAHFDFWERTGRTLRLGNTRPKNVIVPVHDYHMDTRIISIANRLPFDGLAAMMIDLWKHFVMPVEESHAPLEGLLSPDVLFSGLLEIVGEREGLGLLDRAREDSPPEDAPSWWPSALDEFVKRVKQTGFKPYRLHFAIERYHRWSALNPDAEAQARARTMQELYETYGISRLLDEYPEARLRFFRETVFREAGGDLAAGLDQIIERVRQQPIDSDELIAMVSRLRSDENLGPDDDYFLARLSYPHLRPEDAAGFVSVAGLGRAETDIVVILEDDRGEVYRVRRAMNPKEVARLHKLFLKANLDVGFSGDDQFLVAVGERGNLIGGIYYEVHEEDRSAHLKKIVVAQRYRKAGVSSGLMNEFFNRMKAAGMRTVTTGFFRPEYFYGYGFRIERRYAGLVKVLEP